MHDPDCAELGTVFSSLWSVHGWTLWHLICRADETLPCLNWSGFVSSLLSYDPLLYGSVRGGGNPLEYAALVGLLFAFCCPTERMLDWSYFMLGLTLSSTLLHHISCSLLSLLFFHCITQRIPPFLKPLMQQEGRKASVTVWNYCGFIGVLQLNLYASPSRARLCLKWRASVFKCIKCVFKWGRILGSVKQLYFAYSDRNWFSFIY